MDTIRFGLGYAQFYALLVLTISWEILNRVAMSGRLPKLVQYEIVHESAVMAVAIALVETSFICERGEGTFTREYGAHALLNLACGYPCSNRVKHLLTLSSVQSDILESGSKACRRWLAQRGGLLSREEIARATESFIALMRNERTDNTEVAGLYFMALYDLISGPDQLQSGKSVKGRNHGFIAAHIADSSASI